MDPSSSPTRSVPGRPLLSGARTGRLAALAVLTLLASCATHETAGVTPRVEGDAARQAEASRPDTETFQATAYSIEGKTASGKQAREGICAADPKILPLGSRVRVHDAGQYSGECEIADTGRAIKGREIDIYLANDREAKQFGKKTVRVEKLSSAN
jgi:3D (Asp-Asp-Asp) domain-containing protein